MDMMIAVEHGRYGRFPVKLFRPHCCDSECQAGSPVLAVEGRQIRRDRGVGEKCRPCRRSPLPLTTPQLARDSRVSGRCGSPRFGALRAFRLSGVESGRPALFSVNDRTYRGLALLHFELMCNIWFKVNLHPLGAPRPALQGFSPTFGPTFAPG